MFPLLELAAQTRVAAQRLAERRRALSDACTAAEALSRGTRAAWDDALPRLLTSERAALRAHCATPPATVTSAPPRIERCTVVATDGSQIVPDRHDGVDGCFLISVGQVSLSYGTGTRAKLTRTAEIHTLDPDDDAGDDAAERGAARAVPLRRMAAELSALATLAEEAAETDTPALALTDGSLIAWQLDPDRDGGDDPAQVAARDSLRQTLDRCHACRVPIAGYISGPGSRDVINSLRLLACPTDRCTPGCPCRPLRPATDADLFERLLAPGERSPVFTSQGQARGFSHILKTLYGPTHWIAFFYLHVGAEIARIELPAWAADDPALCAQVHALCLDQARKGRGYPVALAEAHEQAVLRAADRQAFLDLLARAALREGDPVRITRKALAKRTRAV